MQGIGRREIVAGWSIGLVLLSGVFLSARPVAAQELASQALSESGGRSSSGTTELTFSLGQAVIGNPGAATVDLSIGFLRDLSAQSVELSSPAAANPPFSMVGRSSLTVVWLANGNPAGTLYETRLSTAADFSAVLGSSQTYNLNATFTGLSPNIRYHTQAAAYSTATLSWSAFASLGSTYTLAALPGSPIGVSTFTAPTGTGFTVNWASGAVGGGYNPVGTFYRVQISTSPSFAAVWASSQTANLGAVFAGLDIWIDYYVRVQAINGDSITTDFTVLGATFTSLPGIINTIAGNGSTLYSGDGGQATNAGFWGNDVAVDTIGNVYIADFANNRIRKVDTNGVITTIAGNGTAGFSGDGGSATIANLNGPYGVAVDLAGNIYIADNGNNRIRKVSVSGIITTVAGNGSPTFSGDGGPATSAGGTAIRVAVDAIGNIYIVDINNARIRKVNTSGTITTLAGTGTHGFNGDGGSATSAQLNSPASVAVAAGNIYIADKNNNRIRKVDSNGIITTVAGIGTQGYSGDFGPATSAELATPLHVAVDATGNIYIADFTNQRVRLVDLNGTIITVAGSGSSLFMGDGGQAISSGLRNPLSVAVASAGDFYVIDDHARIREISVTTSVPTGPTFAGTGFNPTSMQWSWNKSPYVAAYKLLTSTGGIISDAISNRNTYFIETVLSTNTLYSRELVAINSAGTSTSSVVSAYTLAAAPSGIAFGATSTSTVYLTWNANTNPGTTSFEVSYTTTTNFAAGSTVSTAPTTTSTFTTVASLAGQTTYYFRLRAYNGDGIATAFTSVAATTTAVLQSSVTALAPSTGTIGVAFTITGTGFGTPNGDTTRVRFGAGGSTAPITTWNNTQIAGIVPFVSSGAYSLRIERQGSVFTTTDAGTFTVVTPVISTVTHLFQGVGFDLEGTGFGEFVDAATTKVMFDDTFAVGLSSWTDTLIRCVVSTTVSLGAHTVRVVIAPSVGTVQSNTVEFVLSPAMRGQSLAGAVPWTAMPLWFYQGNLRLRAGGGKVTALSHASVNVPPGALAADTNVSIERGTSSGVDNDARETAQKSSALGVMGAPIEFGPSGTQFTLPVTIELPYDVTSVPLGRESSLAMHYWDRTAGAWTALPTEVDTTRHLLRARTDHFSLYQPLLPGFSPAAATAEFRLVDVYAFPNPARRSQNVTVRTQVGLADEVSIHIYDLSGRRVNAGTVTSAQIIDDGNGKGGQFTYDYVWDTSGVGSGVYHFAVTAKKAGSSPIRKTGKVGVIK